MIKIVFNVIISIHMHVLYDIFLIIFLIIYIFTIIERKNLNSKCPLWKYRKYKLSYKTLNISFIN